MQTAGFVLGTQLAAVAPALVRGRFTDEGEVVAETASGKIRGRLLDGVNVFKGVPYGGPTAGANRFKAPVPPQAWTGVRDAFEFGPTAAQRGSMGNSTSEDCLVLNVWTPALEDGGKRPVMVWLHGGGFTSGSASSIAYDGTNLCHRGDVVVMTINHRLNVFGTNFLGTRPARRGRSWKRCSDSAERRARSDETAEAEMKMKMKMKMEDTSLSAAGGHVQTGFRERDLEAVLDPAPGQG